jgi:hypothetical protein
MACSVASTYSSWTLIDVPTLGSILIYSQLVQTVFTSRLLITAETGQVESSQKQMFGTTNQAQSNFCGTAI